jgi:hypothetical protein
MPQTGLIRQSAVESFSGNTEELKRAKHVLDFLLRGSKPAAEGASGILWDAHDRIMKMSIEREHAVGRERPGYAQVHHDEGVWGARRRRFRSTYRMATAEHPNLERIAPLSGQSTGAEGRGMDRAAVAAAVITRPTMQRSMTRRAS